MKNNCNFNSLKNDLKDKKQMVLFVGAGINYSEGKKVLWDDVINYLFKEALSRHVIEKDICGDDYEIIKKISGIDEILSKQDLDNNISIGEVMDRYKVQQYAMSELNSLIKASIVKSTLGKSYISFIQYFLYNQCNKIILKEAFERCYTLENRTKCEKREFYTLYQIARIIILCPFIKAVVSYNYDNFLKQAIDILWSKKEFYFTAEELEVLKHTRSKELRVTDISNSLYDCSLSETDLFIYHVHGFIQSPGEADVVADSKIVLSLEEYYEDSRNIHVWQTATQIHFLSHFTCIFAGLSLSDITTQRMLYYARHSGNDEKIYHICAYHSFSDKFKYMGAYRALMDMKFDFNRMYGLTPLFASEGYEKLYEDIGKIVNEIIVESK